MEERRDIQTVPTRTAPHTHAAPNDIHERLAAAYPRAVPTTEMIVVKNVIAAAKGSACLIALSSIFPGSGTLFSRKRKYKRRNSFEYDAINAQLQWYERICPPQKNKYQR